jgi:hypothetical protein
MSNFFKNLVKHMIRQKFKVSIFHNFIEIIPTIFDSIYRWWIWCHDACRYRKWW